MKSLWMLCMLLPLRAHALRGVTLEQEADVLRSMKSAERARRAEVSAFEVRRDIEVEMGVRTPEGDPIRAPSEDDLDDIGCPRSKKCRRYQSALAQERAFRAEYRKHSQDAVDKATQHYGMAHDPGPVPITNGPSGLLGQKISWSPKFVDVPEGESQESFEDHPSQIKGGQVLIHPAAFTNREGKMDPGMLAAAIRHEEIHRNLFIKPYDEPDISNGAAVEAVINELILRDSWVFRLSASDYGRLFAEAAVYHGRAVAWKNIRVPPSDEDEAATKRAAFHDLALMSQADAMVAEGRESEAIEQVRAGARTAFVKEMSGEELIDTITGWRTSREQAREDAARQGALRRAAYDLEVVQCGFRPYLEDGAVVGFVSAGGREYKFNKAADMDAVKVALLLVRVCRSALDGEGHSPACNDGLAVMARRWREEVFRESLSLWGWDSHIYCVDELRKSLTPTVSEPELRHAADTAARKWEAKRRRETPKPAPPPRDRNGPPGADPERGVPPSDGHRFGEPPFGVKPPW